MSTRSVWLPGPVAIVPSGKATEKLARDQHRTGAASPVAVVEEMSRLARMGVLPARVDTDPQRLVVYTQRHIASLYLTKYRDAYRLGHLAPLTFRDQERLLRGALLLNCPAGWYAYHQVNDLPRNMSAHWELIWRTWQTADVQPPDSVLPPHHLEYLDRLTEVVEATRDIEIEQQRTARPMPYRRKGSTPEERHSARGVYAFQLLRPATLAVGAPVYITDEPELRGRVRRVEDREVVVRFDTAVDYQQIPAQGALQMLPSDRVYQAQLAAIDALRRRQVASPYLLTSLVDRRLRPYRPDLSAQPQQPLDPGQLAAFQRALTVPDQLLVLGPPGTGKTRTITEIAAACAARGQRVLITSHTNRAVDNVLERLPTQVRAVRVGNEDAMTSHARGLMIETQVAALRDEILTATEGAASRLASFAREDQPVGRWHSFLVAQLAEARAAEVDAQRHAAALDATIQRVNAPLAAELMAAEQTVAQARAYLDGVERDLPLARQRFAAANARARIWLLALFFRWQARRRWRRLNALELALPHARAALGVAESNRAATRAQAERAVAGDPDAARLVAARDAAMGIRQAALDEAARAAAMVHTAVQAVVAIPADTPQDLPGWQHRADALGQAVALASARARLLTEWRDRVRDPGEDLQREMLRYADVVAATCIGTATTPLLAELDFDLAIVDEAGQISTPNLLVPLARARRSVLVGDHNQLPPFLDDEVKGWMESLARSSELVAPAKAQEIGELLRRSAFERLYLNAGTEHRVMLTVQRRMPESLARFVSQAFYHNVLQTQHAGGGVDPIFRQPFAMVDTSDRSAAERSERPGRRNEEFGQRGYVNELEADLIVRLLTEYVRWYPAWAVIVPYRAQAERVTELLTKALGDAVAVADNVGTVDSFQGGERDLIVYGFTRSNARGGIGFLKELRRLNVAITRARRQLVLVGDNVTLHAARDERFAELIRSMTDYLRDSGDLRRSREVQDRLVLLAKERP